MKIWDIVEKCVVYFIGMIIVVTGMCDGLRCWHCIADNCDEDPSSNYKASQKDCLEGQICQKVHFEMYSTTDKVEYKSLVRSCAEECTVHNDFVNCTDDLFTTRGCIKRSCCNNEDLCNVSTKVTAMTWNVLLAIAFGFLIKVST
ncbi:hypothetical protein SNE40_022696 [Patella caerulea]|uniref:Uncharacterized protein n=1 Tax=Patella caerulea TaxID=87958 RepID=A0AAN8IW37_PATCE